MLNRVIAAMKFMAELVDIEEFFGVPPELEDPNVAPFENCIRVETQIGEQRVFLSVVPWQSFGELRLIGRPFSVVKLSLSDISHLTIRKTAEDHYMLVRFGNGKTSNLKLCLRPQVMLFWGNEGPDEDEPEMEVV